MDLEKVMIRGKRIEQIAGFNVIYLESITSTNDYLKNLAEIKCPGNTVVCAERQTRGRGRSGKKWYDPAGKGLMFSALLRPKIKVTQALIYSFIPAIILARFLREEYQISAFVKWPNDVYVNGKKLAGILCETASSANNIKYLIAGYGININQEQEDFPPELQNSAISLAMIQKNSFDKQFFLINFLFRISQFFQELPSQWQAKVADEWNSLCYHYNSPVQIFTKNKQIDGIFRGISEAGEAIVETEHELVRLVNIEQFSLR